MYIDYDGLPDEELVKLSLEGDDIATECILARYKNLVRLRARMYFLAGADREDIIQEGMIGLFKAIRDFDSSRAASFRAFAELCIKRQIITAVKTATRQKHMPLNSYISLSYQAYDGDGNGNLEEVLTGREESDPQNLFIAKENTAFLTERMNKVLSPLERSVLELYLEGKSYTEIAVLLKKPAKSIDNALQRIKKKIDKIEDL